jgi:hypothetical protein
VSRGNGDSDASKAARADPDQDFTRTSACEQILDHWHETLGMTPSNDLVASPEAGLALE